MTLIVQKYGGTSVATAERIMSVADRIIRNHREGAQIVAVVSAMGKTTDNLIDLAHQVTDDPDDREMDLLLSTGEMVSCTLMAMALRAKGQPAISLTGAQAGIQTTSAFRQARIVSVDPSRVHRELDDGKIVIVAGFQGITEELDITTLGRGGGDITPVAMAIILGADRCEINTDVDGIFTADPRVVPNARKLDQISYDEMLELANLGARVVHPRAVELGSLHHIPIVVRSTFNDREGTSIVEGSKMEVSNKVRGIAHDTDVAKLTVVGVPDRPGVAYTLFQPLADAGISVDVIVQNTGHDQLTDLSFTVGRQDLAKAVRLVKELIPTIAARDVESADDMAKVSIVGTGMQNSPGFAASMFKALYEAGINIQMITTSDIRITCLIDAGQTEAAVRALHEAFELDQAEPVASG